MSLADPKEKLARAREHESALNTEVMRFMNGDPFGTVYGTDPSNGDHVWRVKVDRAPPMRLSILVGDALHNIRSCLDHLIWQLSFLTTPTPYERAEFPIYHCKSRPPGDPRRDDCFDKRGRQKIRDVPYPAKKIIESVQPYHMRGPVTWPYLDLALIHEINNMDKHRIVLIPAPGLLMFHIPPSAFLGFQTGGPTVPLGLNLAPSGENGYEVFRVPGHVVLSAQEKNEVQFTYDVAIQTSEIGKRCTKSARDLVLGFCNTVDDILSKFERFFTASGPGF